MKRKKRKIREMVITGYTREIEERCKKEKEMKENEGRRLEEEKG